MIVFKSCCLACILWYFIHVFSIFVILNACIFWYSIWLYFWCSLYSLIIYDNSLILIFHIFHYVNFSGFQRYSLPTSLVFHINSIFLIFHTFSLIFHDYLMLNTKIVHSCILGILWYFDVPHSWQYFVHIPYIITWYFINAQCTQVFSDIPYSWFSMHILWYSIMYKKNI